MNIERFIPLNFTKINIEQIRKEAAKFRNLLNKRRSVRYFSQESVPYEVIEDLVMTASSAPSGAHKQPWTYCIIGNSVIKQAIRAAAEKEEYDNYHGRMSDEWLDDLKPFDTDWHKDFLTEAPWLIVLFKKSYNIEGEAKSKNYYVTESVGISAGMLITAIHAAGLVTLTHTPSPMNFLQHILARPENEKPFLLLPVGYPRAGVLVPNLKRKEVSDVIVKYL